MDSRVEDALAGMPRLRQGDRSRRISTTDIVIAQTTIDDEDQALALARGAVERKLAAGAHIDGPFAAVYWWKSEIETAQEWRISYMATAGHLPKLEAWVSENHSYDVPQWVTVPVTGGSDAYLSWVAEETTKR